MRKQVEFDGEVTIRVSVQAYMWDGRVDELFVYLNGRDITEYVDEDELDAFKIKALDEYNAQADDRAFEITQDRRLFRE